jgi:transcription initiation factor TFIIE subunit beta
MVTRTVKDGQLRMVFWNEIKPNEEAGGMPVEQGEFDALYFSVMVLLVGRRGLFVPFSVNTDAGRIEFQDLWHGLKLPDDVELRRELAKGLFPFLLS